MVFTPAGPRVNDVSALRAYIMHCSAATKKLSKLIYDFTESIYKDTGARLVILGSFVGTSGQKQIAW